jgi:hypothetical protein
MTVDAYRNKMRTTMIAAGSDVQATAPNFETRVGKRKWLDRSKRLRERRSLTSSSATAATAAAGAGGGSGSVVELADDAEEEDVGSVLGI